MKLQLGAGSVGIGTLRFECQFGLCKQLKVINVIAVISLVFGEI